MRFINTTTLAFEEIPDSELGENHPQHKYAILSHRWGPAADEVSYIDIYESRAFESKKGFAKLKGFCDLAASLGYRYGWDDTCCINKGDLNELSEAINSMYRWYQASDLCIVYLEDVGSSQKSMMGSIWFERGWTLQELIGPRRISFYNGSWGLLGTKNELLKQLSVKTNIPLEVLSHDVSPLSCSVAERMSWASKRKTERVEDRAYSLLGIFGVNMPQIYGEREKAFRRLQQAIVQQGKDESIFAWSIKAEEAIAGFYAPSVESFANCSGIVSIRGSNGFSENNGEISISLQTTPHSMESYYALLNCRYRSSPDSRIAIVISRTSLQTEDEYVRVHGTFAGGTLSVAYPDEANPRTIVPRSRTVRVPIDPFEKPLNHVYGFWLRRIEPPGHEDCQIIVLSKASNKGDAEKVALESKDWGSAGFIYMQPKSDENARRHAEDEKGWSKIRWMKMGFDEDFNPLILLANGHGPLQASPTQFRRDASLFQQANSEGVGSQAHQILFDNRWIFCDAHVPSRSYGWPSGLSILKADKRKGLSGTLEGLNLRVEVKLVSNLSPHSNGNQTVSGGRQQIWAIEISDTNGGDPERAMKEYESSESCESCLACCFSNDYGRSASHEQDRRRLEARQRRVLTDVDLSRRHV